MPSIRDKIEQLAAQHGLTDALDDASAVELRKTLAISDFALEVLRREISPWQDFSAWARSPVLSSEPLFFDGWPCIDDDRALSALRRFRQLEALRIIARDALGIDAIDDTLRHSSLLAERCIALALQKAKDGLEARFGMALDDQARPVDLTVLALGKLGGDELNFSSDVDLIFAFRARGQSAGPRAIDLDDYFNRLGQRLIYLLSENTHEGICLRVDMRLRPFGQVGRLVLSYEAVEQYYLQEGRDWERYALIKARPVAGDVEGGACLLDALRPFVYRRYLDFAAIDGLREMKKRIDREMARLDLSQHLKLGPGGIREIEFIVQFVQLVRGGRNADLRTPRLKAALAAARAKNFLPDPWIDALGPAYDFLRLVENRLQMLNDWQTHELPSRPPDRQRLAHGLGFADEARFLAALDKHRANVVATFGAIFAEASSEPPHAAAREWVKAWEKIQARDPGPQTLPDKIQAALASFMAHPQFRRLSVRDKERVDRLVAYFLRHACAEGGSIEAFGRIIALLAVVLGRSAYLALLDERTTAREHLLWLFDRSAWLAEHVIRQPILLDDLLDFRNDEISLRGAVADAAAVRAKIGDLGPVDGEQLLAALIEIKQSAWFRLALLWLAKKLEAGEVARQLSELADASLVVLVETIVKDFSAHATMATEFGVVGFGSLGAKTLGFGSDLDLVFLTRAPDAQSGTGDERSITRILQRLVHWLTAPVYANYLYDVDTRLRPDGSKGLLVTGIPSYRAYLLERAWSWEQQALVSARAITGSETFVAAFEEMRHDVLARQRDTAFLAEETKCMRERWRKERDRGSKETFDLKQGEGGLVDIEFIVQFLVLAHAHRCPQLLEHRHPAGLLRHLAAHGVLDQALAECLESAYDYFLGLALDCTLDKKSRVHPISPQIETHAQYVVNALQQLGLRD